MNFLDRIFGRPQVFPVPEAPAMDLTDEIERSMFAIAPVAAVELYARLQASRLIVDSTAGDEVLQAFVRELKLRGDAGLSLLGSVVPGELDIQGSFHSPSGNSASHRDC